MAKAVIATEDRRFYQHGGVDWEGIIRAAWRDVTKGKVVEGGSTITQQLVRNLYISRERTFQRKVKEVCLAFKLSKQWSKDRILAAWMNQVYFGNHAYGVEAAAQTYFSKHAKDLTLMQAALLAGPAAGAVAVRPDPLSRRPRSRAGRTCSRRCTTTATISYDRYQSALRDTSLHLKPGRLYSRIREPYFFSYVRDQLIADLRRPDRPVGRPARLHDDQPRVPARGPEGDQGHALPEGRPGRRGRLDQPGERRDPGDDVGLSGPDEEPVQPRRPGDGARRARPSRRSC